MGTDAPACVAVQLTLSNPGTSVATVDVNRVTTTWWRDGAQHPVFPVRHTWLDRERGFAEVVLPPGASWKEPFAPSNSHAPVMIAVEEAIAVRSIFQPGYTFTLSLPVTVDGKETWYSGTFVTTVDGAAP